MAIVIACTDSAVEQQLGKQLSKKERKAKRIEAGDMGMRNLMHETLTFTLCYYSSLDDSGHKAHS